MKEAPAAESPGKGRIIIKASSLQDILSPPPSAHFAAVRYEVVVSKEQTYQAR